MRLGVCYFPEHWPSEEWERDVAAMADAGLEYVRMAEFSWGVLEPERGTFDFEWLDEAIELIGDHGMQAGGVVHADGDAAEVAGRRAAVDPARRPRRNRPRTRQPPALLFQPTPTARETARIVERVTERYADSPHVAGWQTDNEFGCHETVRCYCDDCADAFRTWLADRYGDIDRLKRGVGERVLASQHGGSFDEIDPPGPTPAEHHPSRLLAYARFSSDSVVEYNRLHADLIREADPDWFVTHNFMGRFPTLNAYDVSEDLDRVAWDSYPTGFVQDRYDGEASPDQLRAGDPDQVGMDHDIYRSALDRPFWVMEQQPGDVKLAAAVRSRVRGYASVGAPRRRPRSRRLPLQVAALSRGSRTVSRRTPEGRRVARPRIRRRRTHVRGVRDSRRGQSRGRPGGGCVRL